VAEVAEACVRLMAQWRTSWSTRPDLVVDLATTGSPALTVGVADHVAAVGRLDRAGWPGPETPPDLRELSSSDEAAFWRDHLSGVPMPDVAGRAVLLLVDATSSLWPVTVGAALLRRSGASVVLPLLLHRRP
jgi:ATP-dependent DNA helicase RecQ